MSGLNFAGPRSSCRPEACRLRLLYFSSATPLAALRQTPAISRSRFLTPDSRVILHYQLKEQNQEPGEWISEPVRHVFGGIFVKEFLLFYGETLTYYLRIMQNGAIRNTDTYEITLADMDTVGNTRYKLLNHMLEAQDHGEEEELRKTWKQYCGQEAAVEKSLQLIRDIPQTENGMESIQGEPEES